MELFVTVMMWWFVATMVLQLVALLVVDFPAIVRVTPGTVMVRFLVALVFFVWTIHVLYYPQ